MGSTWTWTWTLINLYWALGLLISCAKSDRSLTICCDLGNGWATLEQDCSTFQGEIPDIPKEQYMFCLASVQFCCVKTTRERECANGQTQAKQGVACTTLKSGIEKECCESCFIGQMAGKGGHDCKENPMFSSNTPFIECCEDAQNITTTSTTSTTTTTETVPLTSSNTPPIIADLCSLMKGQLCAHNCISTPGSYICTCRPGFELLTDGKTCRQIDEDNRCSPNNRCKHSCIKRGSEEVCSCQLGYQLASDGFSCDDIDECKESENSCGESKKCINTRGAYLCQDIDPPATSNNISQINPDKVIPAEMSSTLKKSCPTGYEYDNLKKVCDDIDECKLGIANCTRDQGCVNKFGSYSCATEKKKRHCEIGYELDSDGKCIDIDECVQHIDKCDSTSTACINTPGSFKCVPTDGKTPCPPGYKINMSTALCEDVDECSEATDGCLPDIEICRNTVGAYECDIRCNNGFEYNIEQDICIDIDECSSGKNNCEDIPCINTVGSYRCGGSGCRKGFRASKGRNQKCVDIDECAERTHNCTSCGETCINVAGAFLCKQLVCKPGETFNRTTCKCEVDCSNSNLTEGCTNSVCPPGHKINSAGQCQDIDECLERNICNARSEICINEPGTYRCVRRADVQRVSPSRNVSVSIPAPPPLGPRPTDDQLDKPPPIRPGCPMGFNRDPITNDCTDIDECATKTHNCADDNQCVNEKGGFRCSIVCAEGFRLNQKQLCIDIDECAERLNNCAEHQICENTISSYICKNATQRCGPGFRMSNNACEDIDECLERNICNERSEMCINEPGAYRCVRRVDVQNRFASSSIPPPPSLGPRPTDEHLNNPPPYWPGCPMGFTRDPITNDCVDINECQMNSHTCLSSQRCDNSFGSFHCTRVISCGTGYTLNSEKNQCEDDDECQLQTDYCRELGPHWICRNTPGSFRCEIKKCPPKYSLSPDGQCQQVDCKSGFYMNNNDVCEDIDECQGKFFCPTNTRCLNTIGSYVCEGTKCSHGFAYNESRQRCIDIDECNTGVLQCKENQVCKNLIGSAVCQCLPGFQLNDAIQCEDMDECSFSSNICPVYTQCKNTIGSYTCECQNGFVKDQRTSACKDINECLENPNICEHNCVNLWGTYRCVCRHGYNLNEDNRTCSDVDECETFKEFTRCVGTCVNTPGSYNCSCPPGYRLGADGGTCQDNDECVFDVCPGQICLNTRGSYRCNEINCPTYFVRDPIHKNRCNRSPAFTCLYGDLSCRDMPMGYSYNFMTFTSDIGIPTSTRQLDLFTMRGPLIKSATVNFEMKLLRVEASSRIQPCDESYFRMAKRQNEAIISLVKSIPGPQEVEIQLMMKLRHHRDRLVGTHVARLIIFVSEFPF